MGGGHAFHDTTRGTAILTVQYLLKVPLLTVKGICTTSKELLYHIR
jgi:hypothetical protein